MQHLWTTGAVILLIFTCGGCTGSPAGGYNIKMENNVYFATVTDETGRQIDLHLDIYRPEVPEGKSLKTILWLHGGGFTYGNDKRQGYIVNFSRAFAAKGYLCLAPDYRVRRKPLENWQDTLNDAVQDTLAALEWVRVNGRDYNIDLDNFILAGGSAGGMIALELISKYDTYKARRHLPEIAALINLWGSLPDIQANKNFPPTLTVHGKLDKMVPYANSVVLNAELNTLGVKSDLFTVENAGHTPVVDEYEGNFPEVVKAIEDFLEKL